MASNVSLAPVQIQTQFPVPAANFNSPRGSGTSARQSSPTFQTVVFSRKTTQHGPDGEITDAFKRKLREQEPATQPPSPLASLVHQTDRHGKHANQQESNLKVKPTTSSIDTRSGQHPGGISKLFANICSCLGLAEQQQMQQQILRKPQTQHEKQVETRQSQEVRKIMSQPFPGDEGKKCLVLDLDETLVHSSFKPIQNPDYIIPVEIEGHVHQVYVAKRPGVDEFMRQMAQHYEIVIYTASLSKYADPLLDQLDIHKVIRFRLFREHCVHYEGSYVKDLSLLDRDITQSIIIDNSPMSYVFHPRNAIGCSSFIDDMDDRELDSISSFLTNIRAVEDVKIEVMNPTAADPTQQNIAGPNGRYEYLLQQVVQLNTDLHKTVALSQALKTERDSLQELNTRLKQDVIRSEEKCDKMQEVLMSETEFKVQSDRKHEQLVQKWKQQLEQKAREFEVLQKNLAPPKDLEQLRLAIQDEVELPHRQRVQGMQLEIEKYREMFYNARRDFEILKTEHEQTLINHGNDIESTLATQAILTNDLKRQLDAAEERAEDMQMIEKVRRLEQDKESIVLENIKLRQEVESLRQAKLDMFQRQEVEATKHATIHTEILGMKTNLELELKATTRQLIRNKNEVDRLQIQIEDYDKKLREAIEEGMRLREQVKQKDLLLVENHGLHNTKLRELRAEVDADRLQFKEKQLEWMDQIASLQMTIQQSESSIQKREKDWQMEQARYVSLQTHDATHTKETLLALEAKLAEKTTELAGVQEALEDQIQKGNQALEQEQLKLHRIQGEKDSLSGKLTTTQELVTKLKAENMSWRSQHKEMEQEYCVLQAKHRDAMQSQQELQSLFEQEKAKLQYLEDDLAKVIEQRGHERDEFERCQTELKIKLEESVTAATNARRTMKEETVRSVEKLTKALTKAERKRDAYKAKCFEVHGRYKSIMKAKDTLEQHLIQLREQHQLEIQQFLAQWSNAEEAKLSTVVRQSDPKLDTFMAEVDQYAQSRLVPGS